MHFTFGFKVMYINGCQYICSVSLRMQFVSIQNSLGEWSEAFGSEAAVKYSSCRIIWFIILMVHVYSETDTATNRHDCHTISS